MRKTIYKHVFCVLCICLYMYGYILDLYWRWVTRSKRQSLWLSCNKVCTAIRSVTQTRCVCKPQIPLIMANTKDGKSHKDKYFDTSRKILSQKMLMCNIKALYIISIIWLWIMGVFFSMWNVKVKRFSTNKKI